ncbi:peptidoglycan/LPS O-acetylase OafA/YrhL [Paenibacillus sp. BK033]|uniref:acyltransferase family protein n=1 Tax=Paenibacillus sp. BK033 TaxID=2512133 RepID=UPI0010DC14FA|nr:acyltransferase [Paenibacillus sp. BK033]TCM92805.1 peptidoglycan/LPS O-acetylase OafA/YrhL [Paenibacillus sp. BK033]
MERNGRLSELDALRGLAALAVMLYHYTAQYPKLFHDKDSDLFINFSWGYLGVQLFFIISGFVIYMTLNSTRSTKDFFVKRSIRLYPAYIVAVVLTFTLTTLYQLPGRTVGLSEALINLSMLQEFIGIKSVDGVYWTLRVEMTFYLFVGALLLIPRLVKNIEVVALIWLLFCCMVKVIDYWVDSKITGGLNFITIGDYCNLFISGIMFYRIRQGNNSGLPHVMIALCLLYQFIFSELITAIAVLIFFAIFYLLIFNKMTFIDIKPLVFLGSISYCLYLIHQNIGYIMIHSLERWGINSQIGFIAPIAVCIVIAYCITKFIEQPVQNFIKKRLGSSSKPVKTIQSQRVNS